jgi:hypothetical protein
MVNSLGTHKPGIHSNLQALSSHLVQRFLPPPILMMHWNQNKTIFLVVYGWWVDEKSIILNWNEDGTPKTLPCNGLKVVILGCDTAILLWC